MGVGADGVLEEVGQAVLVEIAGIGTGAGVSGEPSVRFKYEVTSGMVGHPLDFTVGYREGGVTIDLFLFSTHTNLMDQY